MRLANIKKWIFDNNASAEGIDLIYFNRNNRGIAATKYLPRNTTFIRIPEKLMIHSCMDYPNEGIRILQQSNLNGGDATIAFILLLEMHNPNSFYRPYFDILPEDMSSYPVLFTNKELEQLNGTYCLSEIEIFKGQLIDSYHAALKLVPEFKQFTLDEYLMTRMYVSSRVFQLSIRNKACGGLVPFIGNTPIFYGIN